MKVRLTLERFKTRLPSPNSINLVASDLPRSHSDLPKISSKLPERKSKRRSRKGNRHQSRSKNPIVGRQAHTAKNSVVDRQAVTSKYPIVGRQLVQAKNPIVDRLAAQTNDQLDTKQEIQWVGKPIRETYLDQLVGCQLVLLHLKLHCPVSPHSVSRR